MSITPDDSSPAAYPPGSLHSLAVGSDATRCQDELMDAITASPAHVVTVRNILWSIPKELRKSVLLTPSVSTRHKLRTPLMAAAATSQMPVVGAVLSAIGDAYSDEGTEKRRVKARTLAMQKQLEMVDVDGMNLLMHASCGTCSAVFQALSQAVQPSQLRSLIKAKDAQGKTILHHAVNGKADESAIARPRAASSTGARQRSASTAREGDPLAEPARSSGERLDTVTEGGGPADAQARAEENLVLDPRLPVIESVLEFARSKMWMPEYRKLLQARDGWHRSIIEHAIMTGRTQIFEAVFDAIRRDIFDEKLDLLLDPGVESSHAQTSLSRALASLESDEVPLLVREKTKSLKSDVSKRKDDSTVTSKIQGFIPGNLIVIFQLLLPEFTESSDQPMYLLLVLCLIAPFWSWGAAMSTKIDPDTKNTRASRQTASKHILALPAMFFWGIGTSKIASNSFGWDETASAAALAVATIVIPALDTYFSGRGARATISVITIAILDMVDGKKKKSNRALERSNQLYGQGDAVRPNNFAPRLRSSPLGTSNRRQSAGRPAEEGQAPAAEAARSNAAGGSPHSPVESIWEEGEDDVEMEV
ncbi:unnamed protein product [Scytosiphon promiscuus]